MSFPLPPYLVITEEAGLAGNSGTIDIWRLTITVQAQLPLHLISP